MFIKKLVLLQFIMYLKFKLIIISSRRPPICSPTSPKKIPLYLSELRKRENLFCYGKAHDGSHKVIMIILSSHLDVIVLNLYTQ